MTAKGKNPVGTRPTGFGLRSTAAAEDQNERDDNNPERVIVKKIAQAVIHGSPPSSVQFDS